VRRAAAALLALLAAAPLAAQERAPWLAHDAEAAFHALESHLLYADRLALAFTASAAGAFEADLLGLLQFDPAGRTTLASRGTFGGRDVTPGLTAGPHRMMGGSTGAGPAAAFDMDAPPALREALVVGLLRMGIMHNLAVLAADRPPDRAEGGAAGWVTAQDFRWLNDEDGRQRGTRALAFTVVVDGREAGEAVLELDAVSGLPVRREQVVRFPGGEMTVAERYAGW
jgi:hypothetical protein